MQYLNTLIDLARRGRAALRRGLTRLAAVARGWWHSHWRRVVEEYGYADAFIAVVIAAVELCTPSRAWRLLAEEIVAIYVAVLARCAPASSARSPTSPLLLPRQHPSTEPPTTVGGSSRFRKEPPCPRRRCST